MTSAEVPEISAAPVVVSPSVPTPQTAFGTDEQPSVGALFRATVERFDEAVALRYRDRVKQDWVDINWREFRRLVDRTAAALIKLGVEHGDRVAILSNTRYEWTLVDIANFCIGAVTVPIYPSILAHEVEYVLEHSEAKVVMCEDREQLAKVLEAKAKLPALQIAVLYEGKVKDDDGFVRSWTKLLESGRDSLVAEPALVDERLAAVKSDDVATICYTSGTTGPPKGVVLPHSNLLFEAEALNDAMQADETDETLLFLPLAHIFARVGMLGTLRMGYIVSYAESIERAVDNMQEVRPTFVFSVPRVYEKIYEKIQGDLSRAGRLKKQIFAFAMAVGGAVSRSRQRGGGIPPHLYLSYKAADLLVFGKLKRTFGGKLRFFISGGAPLSREIAEFFHAADLLVLEGYGLTENVAAVNLNRVDKYKFGTVGPALKGVEQRIAADGEIMIRGPNIMREYFKNPEATAEVLESDGWFHTGDIGEIDPQGLLRITDRKKDLIVTAGGKNIAPQNLENHIKTAPFLSQVMVYGDKRKYLSALFTLNVDELEKWAERHEIEYEDLREVAVLPEIEAKVERILKEKNKSLASYETIKRFAIVWPDFEVGEELTPTLKVKRKFTCEKYRDLLESLYAD